MVAVEIVVVVCPSYNMAHYNSDTFISPYAFYGLSIKQKDPTKGSKKSTLCA